MAQFYGDLLSSDPTRLIKGFIPPVSTSRYRYRNARITLDGTINNADVIRLMTFKATDRIVSMKFSSHTFTSATADIGYRYTGDKNDGPALDNDIHGVAVNIASAAQLEVYALGLLTNLDRTRMLWKILEEYGIDQGWDGIRPQSLFDLSLRMTSNVANIGPLLVEVGYVSGD